MTETIVRRLDAYPRIQLGSFPSPVREITIGTSRFWVKDDGLCSSHYGGNKVRKLEHLLGEARQRGAQRLVVPGDLDSHTVRACIVHGVRSGFLVDAVVYPHVEIALTDVKRQILEKLGGRVVLQKSLLSTLFYARLSAYGSGGYYVPLGASTPLTTLGYVRAAIELGAQIRAKDLPEPRKIFLAFGTGGTIAGILIGLELAGLESVVVAVQSLEPIIANHFRLARMVKKTLALLGAASLGHKVMSRLDRIEIRQRAKGYHEINSQTHSAIEVLRGKGLDLDLAFTGKAAAALLRELPHMGDGTVLLWNTHHQKPVVK